MDSSWSVERLEVVGGLVGTRQADRQTIVLGDSYVHMCISFTFMCICIHLFVFMCLFFVFLRPKPLAGLGLDGLLGWINF